MAFRLPKHPHGDALRIEAFGEPIDAYRGETVAAALLAAGHAVFSRSVKYHRPRGPFCLTGRCAGCLMRIDGAPNAYACLTPVEAGMRVEAQNVMGSASHDALGAIDFLFPRGLNHHQLFAGVPVVEQAVAKVARHLAGLGELPDAATPPGEPGEVRDVDLAVVGAGPAGLALARAAAVAGLRVELVDENPAPGGHLACGLPGANRAWADWVEEAAHELVVRRGGRLSLSTVALGAYRSGEGHALALRHAGPPESIALLRARAFALCPGGSETAPLFEGNDLPGIFAARGLLRMVRTCGVVPGERAVVLAEHAEGLAVAEALAGVGVEVAAVVDPSGALTHPTLPIVAGRIERATGHGRVTGVRVAPLSGKPRELACDLLALSVVPAPSFELARQLGLRANFAPHLGFTQDVAPSGSTARPRVFLAGEVTGAPGADAAAAQGERAAQTVIEALA